MRFNVRVLTYSSVCIAIAAALSMVKLFALPQGGSVTVLSMFAVVLIGYWFGPVIGIWGGVAYGILQLIIDPQIYHPVQFLLDYPLAFGALGLSGFFRSRKHGLYIGYCVGACGRLLMSFLSGVIFFGAYAPEGMSPVLYSLWYQFSYIGPEVAITLIVVSIPQIKKMLGTVTENAMRAA